MVKNNTPNII